MFWVERDNAFNHIVPNGWTEKSNHSNFWTDVIPLFKQFEKNIYFFAGDVGAFKGDNRTSIAYEQIENYHFIASGMGSGINENIVITNINKNTGEVTFELIALNGDDVNALGNLEDYRRCEVTTVDEFYN